MAITLEQYKALRKQGLSDEQIRQQEKDGGKSIGGLFGKAADFLGIEKFGRGIGVAAAGTQQIEQGADVLAAQRDKVMTRITENRATGADTSRLKKALKDSLGYDVSVDITDVGTAGLTGKEVAGSAALTALNLLGGGALKTAKTAAPTILSRAASGAAQGAAYGAAGALENDEGAVPGALKGAAIGGVAGALLGVAEKAIAAATEKAPENLMRKVLRQSRQDLQAEASGKKPVLSRQMIEQHMVGSDEAIVDRAARELASSERELQALLDRNQNTYVSVPRLMRSLDEVSRRKTAVFGEKGLQVIRDFKDVIRQNGDRMTLAQANQLKRDIYKELSEASFNADALPTSKEVLRTMASAIRSEMANASSRIADLNSHQQFYIRVIDNVERQLQNKGKLNLLGLSDTIFASAGVSSGEPVSAISAGLAKRAVEGTQFRTRAAVALDKLGGVIDGLPTDDAGNISKTVLLNALAQVAGDSGE